PLNPPPRPRGPRAPRPPAGPPTGGSGPAPPIVYRQCDAGVPQLVADAGEGATMSQGPRYLKPGWLTGRVVNPLLMWLGVVPTLAVRGRTSGEWRTVPVNVVELEGHRYPVAPRRDTQWVR